MKVTRILPVAHLVLCAAMAVALHLLLPVAKFIAFPWNLAGAAPVVLGVAIVLAAGWSLKKHGTTVKPLRRPKTLVTSGVFRLSRNPIYLGFVLVLIGTAVLLGSLTPWLVAAAFAVFLDAVFVRFEERRLEEAFGDAWREYTRRVRRWL